MEEDATSIIRLLGGPTKLASLIGAKRSAISNWPRSGIPAAYWPAIARVAAQDAKTRHITVELLERLRTARAAEAA